MSQTLPPAKFGLLEEKEEQELHKVRLLNVEERPFKRLTKQLPSISALVKSVTAAGSDASSDKQSYEASSPSTKPDAQQLHTLREDLALDFSVFDNSIARLQLLLEANHRERERYEADKQRILEECEGVLSANNELRATLTGARATLEQRKKFDELADKITANRLLRPREDQLASLEKLENECREVERESEAYSITWRERREQFNRIMEEGMLLRRQIRDEKDEVDRREGMDGDDDGVDEDDVPTTREDATPKPPLSRAATPLPSEETKKEERIKDKETQGDKEIQGEREPTPGKTDDDDVDMVDSKDFP